MLGIVKDTIKESSPARYLLEKDIAKMIAMNTVLSIEKFGVSSLDATKVFSNREPFKRLTQ